MRNISFSMTTPQFIDGSKDVTRRFGWWFLKPGDRVRAVEKAMGLKKGETMKEIGIIEIISVTKEPIGKMAMDDKYGKNELRREGYPFGYKNPMDFVLHICRHYKKHPTDECNRIEFRKL